MGYDEFGPAYPDPDKPQPTNHERTVRLLMLVLGLVLGVFVGMHTAHGQAEYDGMPLPPVAHHHPPEDQELHDKFYKTWLMPDNRKYSCCSDEDCYPTIARPGVKTQWQAKQRETGEWIDVPDVKVETERTPPDGRAHICMSHPPVTPTVYCFAPPRGV